MGPVVVSFFCNLAYEIQTEKVISILQRVNLSSLVIVVGSYLDPPSNWV